jgi:hypothetical protein
MAALGLFGDEVPETSDDALPADPAEWLASLGGADDEDDEDDDDEE